MMRPAGHVTRARLRIVPRSTAGPVLITGGAGFVGCNLADRLLAAGVPVTVFDNLSRAGVEGNLDWLRERHGSALRIEVADVRDGAAVAASVGGVRAVVHLAAQVAVTTSVIDPVTDFETNAAGTLNVLDAVRRMTSAPRLIFASTNKVYGALEDVAVESRGNRYEPLDVALRAHGVNEERPLAFHSPYGCSKGAADQYVLDYARSYGLDTLVFRMSCVYGPRQCGTEDQGWVAHFLLRALDREPVTIFGDGMQVRDLLYIDDLLDAFELALGGNGRLRGHAFNIGGGPAHAASLRETLDIIASIRGEPVDARYESWRRGDQRYYVSDVRRFQESTGWRPRIPPAEGLERLLAWLRGARHGATPRRRAASELV